LSVCSPMLPPPSKKLERPPPGDHPRRSSERVCSRVGLCGLPRSDYLRGTLQRPSRIQASFLLTAAAALAGCAELGFPAPGGLGNIQPPALAFQGVTLARGPSAAHIAAHYSPHLFL